MQPLYLRSEGRISRMYFVNRTRGKFWSHPGLSLLSSPKFVTHGIPLSLDVTTDGNFLLSGSLQGQLAIYDLLPLGNKNSSGDRCEPIQVALAPRCHQILAVQWYPVDSGVFLSASRNGIFHLWDTNEMTPVLETKPFQFESTAPTISCMAISTASLSVATGSRSSSSIKLIDIRSGASSHSLTGHASGVCDIAWSPTAPYVLASAGCDGNVVLWDTRKTGSFMCLTILDASRRPDRSIAGAYLPNYAHLRPADAMKKKKKNKSPNNFGSVTGSTALPRSHTSECLGVRFSPDGHFLVSAGSKGDLNVWDLRGYGDLLPRRFVSPTGGRPIDTRTLDRVPLIITPNSTKGLLVWTTNACHVVGFAMEEGGRPHQVLKGHLDRVRAVVAIPEAGELLSAASDGLLLRWGGSTKYRTRTSEGFGETDKDTWSAVPS